jgi:hypothetical protein
MTKQPMSHETAVFAHMFTAPEGQDDLEYLREAQDALDTTQPGAMLSYSALQTRIASVSYERLSPAEKAQVDAEFAR